MKTMTIEVDRNEYHEVQEILRLLSITPEYALTQFFRDLVSQKEEILQKYQDGASAESLIEVVAVKSLGTITEETLRYRQILRNLDLQKKVEPISKLRKSWGGALKWADDPGNLLMITKNDQRTAAMISVETALAMSSMAADDHTIEARCRLMEMLIMTTPIEKEA